MSIQRLIYYIGELINCLLETTLTIRKAQWPQALYSALVVFCLYTCLFSFRKAFNVAAFDGYTLWGLDYKIILVITQVFGYMASN